MPSGVRFLAGILPPCNCLLLCYWSNKGLQKKKKERRKRHIIKFNVTLGDEVL